MTLRLVTRTSLALMTALCSIALAQTPQASILTVETENVVRYTENFANLQQNGTSPTVVAQTATPATFYPGTFIGDIVAINGKKSRGALVARMNWVGLSSNPSG